jgi:hypothetical protein
MGFHSAGGNIILDSSTNSPEDMVNHLSTKLSGIGETDTPDTNNAGWTHVERLKSEISFVAAFFPVGSSIKFFPPDAPLGTSFTFTDGTVAGNVIIDSTLLGTLHNFGEVVHSTLGWSYTVTAPNIIRFYDILFAHSEMDAIHYIGNYIPATVNPSGAVGIFDYSPDGVGTGRTWGGGHRVKSARISAGAQALEIDIRTVNTINIISISPSDATIIFDGIPAVSWNLLANKYQFFLMQPGGGSTSGTFLFAGHLYPSRLLTFCNYITGPINSVSHDGGNRAGFASIGLHYYVNIGSPFTSSNVSDKNKNPNFCLPGYGFGITPIEKIGNPLAGIPIRDDLGNMQVYDAFLAAPALVGGNIRILGTIWDAVLYSNSQPMDGVTSTINGKSAYCVMSQNGDAATSQGSLLVQSAL